MLSENAVERIRNFRRERIKSVEDGTFVHQNVGGAPKFVLHVVPIGSVASQQLFDISSLNDQFRESFAQYGYNLEGIYGIDREHKRPLCCYQVFQNGSVEYVDSELLDGDGILSALHLEKQLFNSVLPRILTLQNGLGVNPPHIVMLSLIGVGNRKLHLTKNQEERLKNIVKYSRFLEEEHVLFDRDLILILETILQSLQPDCLHAQMRPICDMFWQAAGLPRSLSFREDGTWDGEEKGQTHACP